MSVIRKGADKLYSDSGSKSSIFLTLKENDSFSVALLGGLSEILSVDMHSWWDYTPAPHLVCLGSKAECPSCQLGHEPKTKSYIPVVTQEGEPKLLIAGAQIINALKELEAEVGNLNGYVVRVKRTGSGLKTKYVTMGTGKKVDVSSYTVPDLEPALGVMTWDEQVEELAKIVDISDLTAPGAVTKSGKKSGGTPKTTRRPEEVPDADPDGGSWTAF